VNNLQKVTFIMLLALVSASAITALAAANLVPVTRLMDQSSGIAISDLAPPACDSIRATLQTIIVCTGGNCSGSNANELILGSAGNVTIDGKNGDDCIVGGGEGDSLYGGNGNDVLVGGPGADTLDGGQRPKDTDICADDPGSTTFVDCEIIQ
jgi:Ca2+-binding RTX toxin-like protein